VKMTAGKRKSGDKTANGPRRVEIAMGEKEEEKEDKMEVEKEEEEEKAGSDDEAIQVCADKKIWQ
jgi:hypothetical protein